MKIKKSKLLVLIGFVAGILLLSAFIFNVQTKDNYSMCPTPATFSNQYAEWTKRYFISHPDSNDKSKIVAWQNHLEELGCVEAAYYPNELEGDYMYCPDEESFTEFWNSWSFQYLTDNPDVDVDTQMDDWNALMVANECGEAWFNPLDDLINAYLASSTNNGGAINSNLIE